MNKEINKNWADFKSIITTRGLRPQFDYFTDTEINNGIISSVKKVNIYGLDGFILFTTILTEGSVDYIDFEDNYKSSWNKQLEFTDPSGIHQFIPSARPTGTITFFSGKGDNDVNLKFELTDQDDFISKDLTFNEDIWIKDGGIISINAPFGAHFDVDIVHPQAGVVARFCRKIPIVGNETFLLNSEDKSLITLGLILRVTVFNAPDKTAFKAAAWLEGFRATIL